MVFGTFDNLHPGHLSYFSQALNFGEELIIVVARDKNVLKTKGKLPVENEKLRLRAVKADLEPLGASIRVILGSLKNSYTVIAKYRPEVIALGYDQDVNLDKLKREIKRIDLKCQIVRLKSFRPEKYKSSLLREMDA